MTVSSIRGNVLTTLREDGRQALTALPVKNLHLHRSASTVIRQLHSDCVTIQDTQRVTPTDSSPPPLTTSSQADLEFTAQTKKGAKRHKLELMFEAPVDPGALNPRCS